MGGRERGGRRSPAATASAAGRGGFEAGRREAVESSEAAGAASGPPRGWCSQAAAAVVPAAGFAGGRLASGAPWAAGPTHPWLERGGGGLDSRPSRLEGGDFFLFFI